MSADQQEKTVLIQFKAGETREKVDVAVGMVKGSFRRSEQPFRVTLEDWDPALQSTGLFELAPEPPAAPPTTPQAPPVTPAGRQGRQGGGQQQGR